MIFRLAILKQGHFTGYAYFFAKLHENVTINKSFQLMQSLKTYGTQIPSLYRRCHFDQKEESYTFKFKGEGVKAGVRMVTDGSSKKL